MAFSSPWTNFVVSYVAAGERAASAIGSAALDLAAIHEEISRAASEELPAGTISKLSDLADQLQRIGDRLVVRPHATWSQKEPLRAAENALIQFLRSSASAVHYIPESALAGEIASMLQTSVPIYRQARTEYPFRERLLERLVQHHRQIVRTFGEFHSELALSSIRLLTPWTLWRRSQTAAALGHSVSDATVKNKLSGWRRESEMAATRTQELLARLSRMLTSGLDRARILGMHPLGKNGNVTRFESELEARRRKWFGEQSTISSFLASSVHGVQLGRQMTGVMLDSILAVDRENESLAQELDEVITWIQAGSPRQASEFPNLELHVMTAEERTERWTTRLQALALEYLPQLSEQTTHLWSVPVPAFVRRSNPRKLFQESVSEERLIVVNAFQNVVSEHLAIARDLERTREVLAFAQQSAIEMSSQAEQIWDEAHANTLDLLEQRRQAGRLNRPSLEQTLLRSLVRVSAKTQAARDRGQLGVLSYTTKSGWQRIGFEITEAIQRSARLGSKALVDDLTRRRNWIYRRVGLLPPVWDVEPAVAERARLANVLQLRTGPRDLPVLYRRLFRLDPVTDPAFLIGREEEMAALRDTHARWTAANPVAVTIVGARGSGKTSLLNCAETAVLKSAPVYRLALCERVRTWEQMYKFLCTNLQLPEGCDLEAELSSRRRIIILEEFERSYLRVIGGFEASRRIAELIEATAGTTFWIIVLNRTARPLLDMTVSLKDVASVRINAMSLRLESLKAVILQRHNLSGLRLEFAPPPPGDQRVTRLQRALGLERDPADLFFESLYLECQGIFRAAFELWQDSIERIEAGTLVMRQPLRPDYNPLLSELDIDDIFAFMPYPNMGA